jgi:hypothetical protein
MPMPAGSPRAITSSCLGFVESWGPIAVLRLLLLGCLLVGLASGLRNGWVELHLSRFLEDVGFPMPEQGKGFDFNRWLIEGGNAGQTD